MASLDDVRRIGLGLPQAEVLDHFGAPSLRVKGKIFAVLREPGVVTLKLDPEDQHNLVAGYPGVVEPVSRDGVRNAKASAAGWTFVRYEACDEAQISMLLRMAWAQVAPRRLAASLPD